MRNITTKAIKTSMVVILAAVAVLSVAPQASAQEFDLTLTPAKVELEVEPGQSLEFGIEIYNNGIGPLSLLVYPMDYSVTPDNTFIFEEPGYYSYSSASWIEIREDEVEIPPGDVVRVPFGMEVPQDAEPGGHYAVIFFQDATGARPGQGAELTPRVGAQILVTVPGEIVREGVIKDFRIKSDYLSLWAPPKGGNAGWPARSIGYRLEVENPGNVHITVNAAISYHSTFGFGSGRLELGAMTVLPGTIRYFEGTLPSPPFLGRYSAETVIAYGPDQFTFDTERRASTGFNVVPILWIVIVILGSLFLWWMTRLLKGRLQVSIGIRRRGEGEGGEEE